MAARPVQAALLRLCLAALGAAGAEVAESATWTKLTPDTSGSAWPGATQGHVMVVDWVLGLMLLHGGEMDNEYFDDLWMFNLTTSTWTKLLPSGPPVRRHHHVGVFDRVTATLFIHGGTSSAQFFHSDVWSYHVPSNEWSKVDTMGGSVAQRNHAAAFDERSRTLYIHGGEDPVDGEYSAELWAYNLATSFWTQLLPKGAAPRGRQEHSMAMDQASQKLYLYGGWLGRRYSDELWSYDLQSSVWTQLAAAGPGDRAGHAALFFAGAMIMLGGRRTGEVLADVWRFNASASTWASVTAVSLSPSARFSQAAAVDSASGVVYLHGGRERQGVTGSGAAPDLWALSPNRMLQHGDEQFSLVSYNSMLVAFRSNQVHEFAELQEFPLRLAAGDQVHIEHRLVPGLVPVTSLFVVLDLVMMWLSSSADPADLTSTLDLTKSLVKHSAEPGAARATTTIVGAPPCRSCYLHSLSQVTLQDASQGNAGKQFVVQTLHVEVDASWAADEVPLAMPWVVVLLLSSAVAVIFSLAAGRMFATFGSVLRPTAWRLYFALELADTILAVASLMPLWTSGDLEFTDDGHTILYFLLASTAGCIVLHGVACAWRKEGADGETWFRFHFRLTCIQLGCQDALPGMLYFFVMVSQAASGGEASEWVIVAMGRAALFLVVRVLNMILKVMRSSSVRADSVARPPPGPEIIGACDAGDASGAGVGGHPAAAVPAVDSVAAGRGGAIPGFSGPVAAGSGAAGGGPAARWSDAAGGGPADAGSGAAGGLAAGGVIGRELPAADLGADHSGRADPRVPAGGSLVVRHSAGAGLVIPQARGPAGRDTTGAPGASAAAESVAVTGGRDPAGIRTTGSGARVTDFPSNSGGSAGSWAAAREAPGGDSHVPLAALLYGISDTTWDDVP